MQDILENPTASRCGCLFPESIRVDHTLEEGEVVKRKGYNAFSNALLAGDCILQK